MGMCLAWGGGGGWVEGVGHEKMGLGFTNLIEICNKCMNNSRTSIIQ